MDSYYLGHISKNTDWKKSKSVVQSPVVQSPDAKKLDIDNLKQVVQKSEDLMNRLSVIIKKNSFIESKMLSVEKYNQRLSAKNIFLQDQFLILKEKHKSITHHNLQFKNNVNNYFQNLTQLKNRCQYLETQIKDIQNSKSASQKLSKHLVKNLTAALQKHRKISKEYILLKQELFFFKKEKNLYKKEQKHLADVQNIQYLNKIKKLQEANTKLIENVNNTSQKLELNQNWIKDVLQKKEKEIATHYEKIISELKTEYDKKNIALVSGLKTEHDKKIQIFIKKQKQNHYKQEKLQSQILDKHQKIINKKDTIISDLKKEIETWTANSAYYEQNTKQKLEQFFDKEKMDMVSDTQQKVAESEHQNRLSMSNLQQKHDQQLQDLKQKYEIKFEKKSSSLNDRLIELKEEQDDQLHDLRIEMEHELMAEKRNSVELNKQNSIEIQEVSKNINQLKSQLEIKNFKIVNLELTAKNQTTELQNFSLDNQELRKKNNQLQSLWESHSPKIEAQKQQITSLQYLNRQLSVSIHKRNSVLPNSKTDTHDFINNTAQKFQKKNSKKYNVQELLKDIYIYDRGL